MSTCIALLDQALEVGEQEIACLAEGDVEQAESLEADRARLMHEASREFSDQDVDILRGKLKQLLALQKRATAEARSLQDDVRNKLGQSKKESRRFAGYSGAHKPVPRVQNMYLNKQG